MGRGEKGRGENEVGEGEGLAVREKPIFQTFSIDQVRSCQYGALLYSCISISANEISLGPVCDLCERVCVCECGRGSYITAGAAKTSWMREGCRFRAASLAVTCLY